MRRKKKKAFKIPKLDSLKQINLNAAGIDIGSTEIWGCVPEDRDKIPVRAFETFTVDLHEIVIWFKQCGIETVAMESTGIYWIPLYELLEKHGFAVYLVNAQHAKNVPGRKTDILDCQWLQQLHTYGLLRASFRPEMEIRKLRDLSRHRDNLIRYRAAHIQHMQKALHLMNLQLDNVISDITGKTGMKILRAIVRGERNAKKLAGYRDPNCKNSQQIIEKSLQGEYSQEHVFQLKQALELFDFYTEKIRQCECELQNQYDRIPERVNPKEKPLPPSSKKNSHCKNEPLFDLRSYLYATCGVDLTAIDGLNSVTVHTVISETGVDMSRWPTHKHFASWLALSPSNEKSGGKVLKTKTNPTANRANKAFRQAAQSLHGSKSYLGAYYRRMRMRLGAAKAITAAAHKISRIVYVMLKEQKEYKDLGENYFIKKNKERVLRKLTKQASALGCYLVPAENYQSLIAKA